MPRATFDLDLAVAIAAEPKDLVDVDNLVAVQGISEREYLRHWAKQLQLEERLKLYLERSP